MADSASLPEIDGVHLINVTTNATVLEALDTLSDHHFFEIKESDRTGLSLGKVYVSDFSKIRAAFANDGSLGNLRNGGDYVMIPLEDEAASKDLLGAALKRIHHGLSLLKEPSYTLHTFNGKVDHILDMVRALYNPIKYRRIDTMADLQFMIFPRGKHIDVKTWEANVLGEYTSYVFDTPTESQTPVSKSAYGFSDDGQDDVGRLADNSGK